MVIANPLTDTLLGYDVVTGAPVRWSASARRLGLYLIGTSGMGKTTLIDNLVMSDIVQGRGLLLVDAHGDLFTSIQSRPETFARRDDVVLLDVLDIAHP